MEPANNKRQVLLLQIARGAGKARLMSAGPRSAEVEMTLPGSKEVSPTMARNWGRQASDADRQWSQVLL